jgi:hypothetical protein
MKNAQKRMKYLGIAYFMIALFGVLLGGLFIWNYSHSYESQNATMMQSILLPLSYNIIVNVMCWNASMAAAYNPSSAKYPLAMSVFGIGVEVYHFIVKMMEYGTAYALDTVPWISLTLYILTIIVALKLKKEAAASKAGDGFSYGNSKHLVVK